MLPCAIVLGFALIQLWYSHACGPLMPGWDESEYLTLSLRLFDALRQHEWRSFLSAYLHSPLPKAPGIALLPLPVYALFGKGTAQALLVNTTLLILLSFYSYRLAERWFGKTAAILAIPLMHTMPLLYQMSRMFYVEFALAACVAAWIYHLQASEGLNKRGHALALGLLLGAGLLLKIIFPLYVIAPTFIHLFRHGQGRADQRRILFAGAGILALGLGLASSWYAVNWSRAVAGAFHFALHYGGYEDSLVRVPSQLRYGLSISKNAVSFYYTLAGLILIFRWARLRKGWTSRLKELWSRDSTTLLLGWILLPALILACAGKNRTLRYCAPILPGIAIAIAAGLSRLKLQRRLRPALLAAFFLFPLDFFARESFGRSLLPHRIRTWYGWAPREHPYAQWDLDAMLDHFARLAHEEGRPWRVLYPANAPGLTYLSLLRGYPLVFIHPGPSHGRDLEKILSHWQEQQATHLLLLSGHDRGRSVAVAALPPSAGGLPPLTEVMPFELKPGLQAHLFAKPEPRRRTSR